MKTKFKYREKVKIISGFYRGVIGKVEKMDYRYVFENWRFKKYTVYVIECGNYESYTCFEETLISMENTNEVV